MDYVVRHTEIEAIPFNGSMEGAVYVMEFLFTKTPFKGIIGQASKGLSFIDLIDKKGMYFKTLEPGDILVKDPVKDDVFTFDEESFLMFFSEKN